MRILGESTSRTADVIGADTTNDVALIKIPRRGGLPTVTLGDSVKVGDPVVAIGYALGLAGDPTVTSGIVSATGRSLDNLSDLIQTDAAISPGDSGRGTADQRLGPSRRHQHRFGGVPAAVRARTSASPSRRARRRAWPTRLRTPGAVSQPRAVLGITTSDAGLRVMLVRWW